MESKNRDQTCGPSRSINADHEIFRENFNRWPFSFTHRLVNHPLLRLERVVELALALRGRPGEVYFDLGVDRIDLRWDEMPHASIRIDQVLADIAAEKAWILIRRAELDPAYRELLDQCLDELQALCGDDWRPQTRVRNAIIFLTSPRRLTTYHIDRECNFLLQIRGEKTVYVFDQNDREVLTEDELERFWAVDKSAARYKPELRQRARIFQLRPGDGIHLPVNAPHWVQNGDAISLSLSINFQFHDSYLANKYRANYYLRRLGLSPAPPGRHPLRDALVACAFAGASVMWKGGRALRNRIRGPAPSAAADSDTY